MTTNTIETAIETVEITITVPKTWTHTSYAKGSNGTEVSWSTEVNLAGINKAFAEHLVHHALKQKCGDAYNSRKFTKKELKEMDEAGVPEKDRPARLEKLKQSNLKKVVEAIEANKVPQEGERGDPMKKAENLLGKLTPEQIAELMAKLGQ